MNEDEIRIGVFICQCGTNIGGFVDVPDVAEYIKTLPDVAYVTTNLYTCAEDGLSNIRDAIKENNLNRVVVASCTPRTHAPLFQHTCEEAGLNKYLFTFVNLREHCSWVHMKEKENATEKAKELVRMGVARARLLQPQEEARIDVEPAALVVGGGVAGMAAAVSIANMGFPVTLVEREKELGGFVRNLGCLWQGRKDPIEALQPIINEVKNHKNIELMLESELLSADGFIGNYDIVVDSKGKQISKKVGTIVVTTGALEYIPEGLYGYETYDNVVTLTEFEILARNKKLPKMESIAFIQCVGSRGQDKTYCSRICCNVAIKNAINLADNWKNMLGLADEKGEAMEAVAVEKKAPEEVLERRRSRRRGRRGRGEEEEEEGAPGAPKEKLDIAIFNRDIMSYGVEHELNFNKAREKHIRFVRYTPQNMPKVSKEGDKLVVDYWHETLQLQRKMPVDMVVLSTPLIGQPDARELSKMLKVPLGQEGFFLEAHVKLRPVDFATDGIYLAGTCRGPADIPEAVSQGLAAASRAAIPLARGYVQPETLTAFVQEDVCSGCGTCIEVCPYSAIRKTEDDIAEVIVAACKGCGCCGATCPEGAILMSHYTDQQLLAEAKAALSEVIG